MMNYHSDEQWKDIPGYEGIYQASTYGRIRTVEGKTTYTERHGVRRWQSRILKGRGDRHSPGRRVNLWKDGKAKEFLVARIIATTFLGEPQPEYTVNHIDGDRMNNHISNLEWLSRADNIRHAFDMRLYPTQKPITVELNGQILLFRSRAQLDCFLNRYHGYVAKRLMTYNTVFDSNGNEYRVLSF